MNDALSTTQIAIGRAVRKLIASKGGPVVGDAGGDHPQGGGQDDPEHGRVSQRNGASGPGVLPPQVVLGQQLRGKRAGPACPGADRDAARAFCWSPESARTTVVDKGAG